MLKDNPVMKKLVATGEERVGKLAQALMSNERFVAGIQAIVSRALSAKGAVDKSLRAALSAMNVPTSGDLERLQAQVEALSSDVAELEAKLAEGGGEKRER